MRENEDKEKHPGVDFYEYYVCWLKVGGVDYTVKSVVAVGLNGERYYDHKLTQIEKGALLSTTPDVTKPGEESDTPLSAVEDKRLLSILQVDSSKVADENGEPLVVYHGTSASFWAFDKAKIGINTNNKGILGNGFYTTDDSGYAAYCNRTGGVVNKDGIGNEMPLLLSLKNPLDWNGAGAVRVARELGFPQNVNHRERRRSRSLLFHNVIPPKLQRGFLWSGA